MPGTPLPEAALGSLAAHPNQGHPLKTRSNKASLVTWDPQGFLLLVLATVTLNHLVSFVACFSPAARSLSVLGETAGALVG